MKFNLSAFFICVSVSCISQTATFNYTGTVQTYIVPSGITSVNVDVRGAGGSVDGAGLGVAGKGGRVQATLLVTPLETLFVFVGGAGSVMTGGFNGGGNGGTANTGPSGGGGGGMSDIRQGGNSISDIVIAGGGGGGCGGYIGVNGGNGGNISAQAGTNGAATGGAGGTQLAGGNGGNGAGNCGLVGTAGTAGQGGTGGNTTCGNGFGGGGGGGGGYFGGGGGGAAAYLACCPDWSGGGGGGSSFAHTTATSVLHTQGFQTGNGLVVISWSPTGIASAENSIHFTVSPNPFYESAILSCENAEDKNFDLTLYNLFGQEMRKEKIISEEHVIYRNDLSSGMYFYTVKAKERMVASGKLVAE